jgi:transposase InsO family protein
MARSRHSIEQRLNTLRMLEEDAGMTHSMSRVGRCLDHAPIESIWGTLKVEMYYLREFQAYSELTTAIDTYIFVLLPRSFPETTRRHEPCRIQVSCRLGWFSLFALST